MKLRTLVPLLSLPLLAATAGDALAQAEPGAGPPTAPGNFMLMGPDGVATSLEAALTILTAEGEGENIYRFDLGGQYMTPSGWGGYGRIAGSSLEDESKLGSLEVGGLWNTRGASADVTVRLGVVLPTSGEAEDLGDLGHIISTFYTRPSDLVASAPDTTVLRAAVSPMIRRNNFVARADAGLDLVLEDDDGEETFLHLDLGAGYDDGKMAFLFEMSTLILADSEDDDNMAHVAALTGQLHAGTATPYLALSTPLGDSVPEDTTILGITLGVRGQL